MGLNGAGKTSVLNAFNGEICINVMPTKNFSLKSFDFKDSTFNAFEVAGNVEVRKFWESFYSEHIQFIIYVIDMADFGRIEEAVQLLMAVLYDDKLTGIPLLIMLNKIDVDEAITVQDFSAFFKVDCIKDRIFNIVECSALSKKGIFESLEWIYEITANS